MLLIISEWLMRFDASFSVFSFYTLRALLSLVSALMITLLLGPRMIRWLHAQQLGQIVRDDGPSTHLKKANTPTMGGVLIIVAVVMCSLLWSDLANPYVWVCLFTFTGFGLIGAFDDLKKIRFRHSRGLSARWKFLWQSVLAFGIVVVVFLLASRPEQTQLFIPVFKNLVFNLGWMFIPLAWLVLVSSANSLNLTDGLDGLAIGPSVLIVSALGVFAYASGNSVIAAYLQIPYLWRIGEVIIFCAAIAGACIGFL